MTQTTEPVKKVWWKSRTIWVSFFTFVYGVVGFFFPQVLLDPAILTSVGGIIFMILRFLTGVEISLSDIKK